MSRLRRGVVEHRARAGGLREPIGERDQRESHPHPSGRRPVAPLSSYGPSVVRRRRDVTADAPGSGSRVILCPLHHVTPADGAPHVAGVACFFPDHRLSNSASDNAWNRRCGSLDSLRSLETTARAGVAVIPSGARSAQSRDLYSYSRYPEPSQGSALRPCRRMRRERPTWLLAQVGRIEPLRSDVESMRYGASPRNPDPAPLFPASSTRYPSSPVLPSFTWIVCCFRSPGCSSRMLSEPTRSADVRTPDPNAPTGARQVAASRCWPACRGRAMGNRVNAVMGSASTSESSRSCGHVLRKREIAPPMVA